MNIIQRYSSRNSEGNFVELILGYEKNRKSNITFTIYIDGIKAKKISGSLAMVEKLFASKKKDLKETGIPDISMGFDPFVKKSYSKIEGAISAITGKNKPLKKARNG